MDLRGVIWRKSSRSSGGGNGDCVEVCFTRDAVAVRDSKDPEGEVLAFSSASWRTFIAGSVGGVFRR
ncbi:DUF397 domain-containing protein [Micromonospora sp. NPDC050200]|uniref:DUF397 domain-containing protein n=1 Tax=Micromonospora sp. NPDC050200 TaxID=3155664 RepID=UPI0033ED29BD